MITTSKKQKLIGIQEYVNPNTGELVPMQVTSIEDRDFNFHKVWMEHLVMSLQGIFNKKLELAFWIINNLNKENQLIATQRSISIQTGFSLQTVSLTMKLLQSGELPFLRKINSGAYIVNPDVLFKGSHNNRMGIIFDYSSNVKSDSDNKDKTEGNKEGKKEGIYKYDSKLKTVAESKENYKSDDPNQLELNFEGSNNNGNECNEGANQTSESSESPSMAI